MPLGSSLRKRPRRRTGSSARSERSQYQGAVECGGAQFNAKLTWNEKKGRTFVGFRSCSRSCCRWRRLDRNRRVDLSFQQSQASLTISWSLSQKSLRQQCASSAFRPRSLVRSFERKTHVQLRRHLLCELLPLPPKRASILLISTFVRRRPCNRSQHSQSLEPHACPPLRRVPEPSRDRLEPLAQAFEHLPRM